MLSAVFIVNEHGVILIEKQYREHIERAEIELACQAIQDRAVHPIPGILENRETELILFIHPEGDIFLVGVVAQDDFALSAIQQLRRLGETFRNLLKGGATEQGVKDEYPLVYQILDWALDFGVPFIDEMNTIRALLEQPVTDYSKGQKLLLDLQRPWRRVNPVHPMNQLLLDVEESVYLRVAPGGRISFCHIDGRIQMINQLSGGPHVKVFLDPQFHCEDVSFHRSCENEGIEGRVIQCYPPDGPFLLMKYRNTTTQVALPLWVTPKFSYARGSCSFELVLSIPVGSAVRPLEGVSVVLTLPIGMNEPGLDPQEGAARWESQTRKVIWSIGDYRKSTPIALKGHATLEDDYDPKYHHPTVIAHFVTTGPTVSGIKIERVEIEEGPKGPGKGVRYIVKSGCYEFRV